MCPEYMNLAKEQAVIFVGQHAVISRFASGQNAVNIPANNFSLVLMPCTREKIPQGSDHLSLLTSLNSSPTTAKDTAEPT